MKAVHSECLEELNFGFEVEMDEDDLTPYKLSFVYGEFETWLSEQQLNNIIKSLNKMKKIRKTKLLE